MLYIAVYSITKTISMKNTTAQEITNLHNLIRSGGENISLAFEIADSLGIPNEVLLQPYEELFELCGYHKCRDSIGQLHNLKILDLYNNNITTLPESIGQLHNLKILDLDNNNITTLPESIGQLHNLEHLYLNNNNITTLPDCIGQLQSLKHLYLNNNNITTLPESIKK